MTVEKVKEILQITDISKDSLILSLIELAEEDYTIISGSTERPLGSDLTIIMMTGYLLQQKGQGGIVKSKTLGLLKVDYAGNLHSYPPVIYSRIKRLAEIG